ncbi:MAG: hypothetical protein HW421_2280 [Ignavibacteria bacterium]|nr:hypothetical protein [Ignavibacteria bacterium]
MATFLLRFIIPTFLFCCFNPIEIISQLSSPSKAESDTLKFLSPEKFKYADTQRFLIDGSLPYIKTHIRPVPTIITSVTATTIFIAQHSLQLNTIWKTQSTFHIQEDGAYAAYADKFGGHLWGGYFGSYFFRELFLECGVGYENTQLYGTLMGLGYMTYIEIQDGFGTNWGFSPSDYYFNLLGCGLFYLQGIFPYLQNFTPKFTIIPAKWHGELPRYPSENLIDDYSSHTAWLSLNIHNMLPEDYKKFCPSWLGLSLGYAVRNLCGSAPEDLPYLNREKSVYINPQAYGNMKFIIALDYDLVKILPDLGDYGNWLKQTFNLIKLPAPAIEIGQTGTRFFLIYPFPIKLGSVRF